MRARGALKILLATSIIACCASAASADTVDTQFTGTITSFHGFGWNQADIGGSVTIDVQNDSNSVSSFENNVLSVSSPIFAASILDGVLGAGINLEPNGSGSGTVVDKYDFNNNTVTFSATTTGTAPSHGFTGSVFSLSLFVDGVNDTFEVVRNAFIDGKVDRADSGSVTLSSGGSGSGVQAPEIDAATAPAAFALLLGGLAILSGRKAPKRSRI